MKHAQMAKELTKIADQKGGKQVMRRFRRQRLMTARQQRRMVRWAHRTRTP